MDKNPPSSNSGALYSGICKKCGEEVMYWEPNQWRVMLCAECTADEILQLRATLKTLSIRDLRWARHRIEQLEKELRGANAWIVSLLNGQTKLNEKRAAAVNRAHRLQLRLNNYEHGKNRIKNP